jgi:hypothetical protein
MNAAELDKRRAGAIAGVLNSPDVARRLAAECAKIEALFLIAEQLAELNQRLDKLSSADGKLLDVRTRGTEL